MKLPGQNEHDGGLANCKWYHWAAMTMTGLRVGVISYTRQTSHRLSTGVTETEIMIDYLEFMQSFLFLGCVLFVVDLI